MNDMNNMNVTVRSEKEIEEERLELQQRLDNTMNNITMVKDATAKAEALRACEKAFMSLTHDSMEKFGIPSDFTDIRLFLDWADLIVEKFT